MTVDAASDYAGRGWHVLPLHGKVPAIPESEGGHGYLDATTDPERIRRWWDRRPDANIGIATKASRLLVLDVDPRNGGTDTLADLERVHGRLPETVEAITGNHGRHIYFRAPDPDDIARKTEALGPGLDLPNLVVVPPSIHPETGRGYEWKGMSHPDDVPLADTPPWLAALATQPKPSSDGHREGDGKRIPERRRNTTLASLAGSMRNRGMTEEEIGSALLAVNEGRCDPPLDDEEVRGIAASVARYEPGESENLTSAYREGPSEVRLRVMSAAALRERGMDPTRPPLTFLPVLGHGGFIVVGWSHMLSAYPKVGKTELMVQLCGAWCAQGLRVRYYSEEPEGVWEARLAKLPAVDGLDIVFALGVDAAGILIDLQTATADVVIVDTIRLLRLEDENSNSQINRALTPLIAAARQRDQTLIMLHHTRKGAGDHGVAAAGGHAFLGAVDVALEIVRTGDSPRRRTVRGWGRVVEVPTLAYEMDDKRQGAGIAQRPGVCRGQGPNHRGAVRRLGDHERRARRPGGSQALDRPDGQGARRPGGSGQSGTRPADH